MILPTHAQCADAIKEMATFMSQLTGWEQSFVTSNLSRTNFTPLQREQIGRLAKKYELTLKHD